MELVPVTTEIRWLWLKYKLCRVKSFRVIVSIVKYHDQRTHIYVVTSWYTLRYGKQDEWWTWLNVIPVDGLTLLFTSCLLILLI